MKQTATLEIEIPDKCTWTVADCERAMKRLGIKVKVTKILNHLKI